MSSQGRSHPALKRFMSRDVSAARLLLVNAASGTGRGWFARSWLGERSGEVHDWSNREFNEQTAREFLTARLQSAPDLFLAVILAPSGSTLALESFVGTVVANHRDLLLQVEEIEQFNSENGVPTSKASRSIYNLTGGWLGAVKIMVDDPAARSTAQQVIRSGLALWLQQQEHLAALSDAAYLSTFDTEIVEAFYGEFSSTIHTLDELVGSGLVGPDGYGKWIMPVFVREVLTEHAGMLGWARISILEQAAMAAMALTQGPREALESALERRMWPALMYLLMDHWADIFINNPGQLLAVVSKIPRFLIDQSEYMRLAMRMLGMVGKEGMELQLPGFPSDYSADRTAQRIHKDALRLYRKPNVKAITIGMLELFHLRLGGFFEEAGEAALRMRKALHRALDHHRIKPTLASFAELHAGITLHLAGRETSARQAYEMAYHWAKVSEKAFLLADVSGKAALLEALDSNQVSALSWLEEHDRVIGKVGWGRKIVSRSASLARAYVAMTRLDFDTVGEVLRDLPPMPDNDEFWFVHVYLMAMQRIHIGVPEVAQTLIGSFLEERSFSASSPLAERLLDEALLFAELWGGGSGSAADGVKQNDGVLKAFGYLISGQSDRAVAVLQKVPKVSGVRRRGSLTAYFDIAARNPDGLNSEAMQHVYRLYEASGNISELALMVLLPGWSQIVESLELTPDESKRLKAVSGAVGASMSNRPVLTPREQEILAHLRANLTRRQIAEADFRSENTVKTQIRSLYAKLEASDLEQALKSARDWGL